MRYMLLVKTTPSAWERPVDGFDKTIEFMTKLNDELAESGELVDAAGLADPTLARTIRRHGDDVVTTEGPSEAGEVLGGYWVLDCASHDRAMDIAAKVVDFDGVNSPDTIEVRPIMDDSGVEM